MKNITITIAILTAFSLPIYADNLFDSPSVFDNNLFDSPTRESNSFYKSDGSLVIIKNAKSSGLIVKDDGNGIETEYYVVPKDDGSKTFIYDSELLVCDNKGCY